MPERELELDPGHTARKGPRGSLRQHPSRLSKLATMCSGARPLRLAPLQRKHQTTWPLVLGIASLAHKLLPACVADLCLNEILSTQLTWRPASA